MQVSRWENGAVPIGPQADRLLRFMVAQGRLATYYPTERLSKITIRSLLFCRSANSWALIHGVLYSCSTTSAKALLGTWTPL